MLPTERPDIPEPLAPTQRPEFYLGTSERDVMHRLSRMLKKQGYLGIARMDGTTTFYLDPSAHAYRSLHAIHTITEQYVRYSPSEHHDLVSKAEAVLDHFAFNPVHSGYGLLRTSLLLLIDDYRLIRPITKGLYRRLAEIHQMEIGQIERNIRYAISRSSIRDCNSLVIHRLLQMFTLLCAGTAPEALLGEAAPKELAAPSEAMSRPVGTNGSWGLREGAYARPPDDLPP